MDLKCISDGSGGFYYKTHLPRLGQNPESLIIPSTSNPASSSAVNIVPFEVGDRVRVTLDVTTLKDLQEGHGGWNDKMEEVQYSQNISHFLCFILTDSTLLTDLHVITDWSVGYIVYQLTDYLTN